MLFKICFIIQSFVQTPSHGHTLDWRRSVGRSLTVTAGLFTPGTEADQCMLHRCPEGPYM